MKKYVLQDSFGAYGARVYLLIGKVHEELDTSTDDSFKWIEYSFDAQTQAAIKACESLCIWGGHDEVSKKDGGLYWRFEFSDHPWDSEDFGAFRDGLIPFEQIKERLEGLLGPPLTTP